MKHQVSFELDLTNPEEANLYNMIRNLDGIKKATSAFKDYLHQRVNDESKEKRETFIELETYLQEILVTFEDTFKENGVTV